MLRYLANRSEFCTRTQATKKTTDCRMHNTNCKKYCRIKRVKSKYRLYGDDDDFPTFTSTSAHSFQPQINMTMDPM